MSTRCTHLDSVKTDHANTQGCEECLRTGDTWVHLRLCRACGHVGCCDDSKNRHARKHFHATTHPIVTSIEPGESWSWCFVDEVFLKALDRSASAEITPIPSKSAHASSREPAPPALE